MHEWSRPSAIAAYNSPSTGMHDNAGALVFVDPIYRRSVSTKTKVLAAVLIEAAGAVP
jgi:hypothetical protein